MISRIGEEVDSGAHRTLRQLLPEQRYGNDQLSEYGVAGNFRDDDADDLAIGRPFCFRCTLRWGTRAEGTENERIALAPDMLWSDHMEGVELKGKTVASTITLYPKVSVCTYTVKILNVENLKYVSGVSGSLSSLAGGLLPGVGPDALTEERVTIPFEAVVGKDEEGEKTIITGGLLTFGHCPSVQCAHWLPFMPFWGMEANGIIPMM